MFPPFGDDYIICSDGWPTATVQSPPTHMTSEPLRRESLSATPPLSSQEDVPLFIQRETRPARSPEEEAPSLSVHPSEATGITHTHTYKREGATTYCRKAVKLSTICIPLGAWFCGQLWVGVQWEMLVDGKRWSSPYYSCMTTGSSISSLLFPSTYYRKYLRLVGATCTHTHGAVVAFVTVKPCLIDVVPSKEKVFISYYPESSTRSSVRPAHSVCYSALLPLFPRWPVLWGIWSVLVSVFITPTIER